MFLCVFENFHYDVCMHLSQALTLPLHCRLAPNGGKHAEEPMDIRGLLGKDGVVMMSIG